MDREQNSHIYYSITSLCSTMPAVTSGRALVTGANGFVATWLVRKLLERGFSVRGTVRSASKVAQLKQVFAEFGDKFECIIVEDIVKVCFFSS